MFTSIRTAMLALAAVATLSVGALVSTTDSADARPGFGRGGMHGGGIGRVHIGGPRIGIGRAHLGHRFVRPIRIGHIRPHFRPHFHPRPHWCWRFPWRCKVGVRWPRPIIVGAVAAPVVAATYAVAPRVTNRCTCLTKEYTQDGLVVFQDVCTKEIAAAPQGNTQLPPVGSTSTYPVAPQTQLQPAPEAQPAQPQLR
jgi:hypothetical protein